MPGHRLKSTQTNILLAARRITRSLVVFVNIISFSQLPFPAFAHSSRESARSPMRSLPAISISNSGGAAIARLKDGYQLFLDRNRDGRIDEWYRIEKNRTYHAYGSPTAVRPLHLDVEETKGNYKLTYRFIRNHKTSKYRFVGVSTKKAKVLRRELLIGCSPEDQKLKSPVEEFERLLSALQPGAANDKKALQYINQNLNAMMDPSCSRGDFAGETNELIKKGMAAVLGTVAGSQDAGPGGSQYLQCMKEMKLTGHAYRIEAALMQNPQDMMVVPVKLFCSKDTFEAKSGAIGSFKENAYPRQVYIHKSVDFFGDRVTVDTAKVQKEYAKTYFHELLHYAGIDDDQNVDMIEACCSEGMNSGSKACNDLKNDTKIRERAEQIEAQIQKSFKNFGQAMELLSGSMGTDNAAEFVQKYAYSAAKFEAEEMKKCMGLSGEALNACVRDAADDGQKRAWDEAFLNRGCHNYAGNSSDPDSKAKVEMACFQLGSSLAVSRAQQYLEDCQAGKLTSAERANVKNWLADKLKYASKYPAISEQCPPTEVDKQLMQCVNSQANYRYQMFMSLIDPAFAEKFQNGLSESDSGNFCELCMAAFAMSAPGDGGNDIPVELFPGPTKDFPMPDQSHIPNSDTKPMDPKNPTRPVGPIEEPNRPPFHRGDREIEQKAIRRVIDENNSITSKVGRVIDRMSEAILPKANAQEDISPGVLQQRSNSAKGSKPIEIDDPFVGPARPASSFSPSLAGSTYQPSPVKSNYSGPDLSGSSQRASAVSANSSAAAASSRQLASSTNSSGTSASFRGLNPSQSSQIGGLGQAPKEKSKKEWSLTDILKFLQGPYDMVKPSLTTPPVINAMLKYKIKVKDDLKKDHGSKDPTVTLEYDETEQQLVRKN